MPLDCEYYDNDEIMAALGRQVVDQYIAFSEPTSQFYQAHWSDDLRGAVSFIIARVADYVDESPDEDTEEATDETSELA